MSLLTIVWQCDTNEGKPAKKNKRKKRSSAQAAADAAYNFALPSTFQQPFDQVDVNEEERGRKKSKKNLVEDGSAEASNTYTRPPHPPHQRRRSTRMSRTVDYRDPSPETTEKLRELSSEAVDADAEKQIRRDRRLAIMAKYDLPASELPPNYNPGILTPLRDGLSDEEDNTQQGARERRKGKDPVSRISSLGLVILIDCSVRPEEPKVTKPLMMEQSTLNLPLQGFGMN